MTRLCETCKHPESDHQAIGATCARQVRFDGRLVPCTCPGWCPPEVRVRQDRYERLLAEVKRQAAEIEAFRRAIRDGDGPSCEDVCQRECIGVCGASHG